MNLRRQRGQAWAEFIVIAAFVLVPLAIVVPLLGKYIDAKHKVEQAARYAAWERSVWYETLPPTAPLRTQKTDAAVLNEAQRRVLGTRYAVIYSRQGDSREDSVQDPLLSSMHVTANSPRRSVLRELDRGRKGLKRQYLGSSTENIRTPGVSSRVERALGLMQRLPHLGHFDIDTHGAHRADVHVKLMPPFGFPEFPRKGWTLSRSLTMVTDAWNVGGPDHNVRRVQALVPTALLDRSGLRRALRALGSVEPLQPVRLLEFGKVDVEPVPEQYLGSRGR